MGTKEEILSKNVSNASTDDISRIDKDLDGMNRGRVKDIWDKVQVLYQIIKDPKAAWGSKAMAIGALIYLISPIDAIPDITPILGLSDDVAIILATCGKLAIVIGQYLNKPVQSQEEAVITKY